MTEQEAYKIKMIARCEEQGHELGRGFRRVVKAAVKRNSYNLLEAHWWHCVCVAVIEILEREPVPRSLELRPEYDAASGKFAPTEYDLEGVEAYMEEWEHMSKVFSFWDEFDENEHDTDEARRAAAGRYDHRQLLLPFAEYSRS